MKPWAIRQRPTIAIQKMKLDSKLGRIGWLLVLSSLLHAQGGYGRARRSVNPVTPATTVTYPGVVATFHGKLKDLDKHKLDIETDEGQLVTIRISGKTKFLKNGKPIKPSEIDMETVVSVDASQDKDASILAKAVTIDGPNEKPGSK